MLVTKDSLNRLLQDPTKQTRVIGRALVALFDNNQTSFERNANATIVHNDIGFTGADAKCGSLTARYYKRNKTLLQWHIKVWMRPAKDGFPRLCKYHRQLNILAEKKAARKNEGANEQ